MGKQITLNSSIRASIEALRPFVERVVNGPARLIGQKATKPILNIGSALLAALFIRSITGALPYFPEDWRWPLALAGAIIWAVRPNLGVVYSLVVVLLPIAYNSFTLALLFILLLVAVAVIEIGALGPYAFLVFAGTTTIYLHPQHAIWLGLAPLLAGFLGLRRGVVLGALACFWVQLLAASGGLAKIGLLVIPGQTTGVIAVNPLPVDSILDFSWLSAQVNAGKLDTDLVTRLFAPFGDGPFLWAQIGLWAVTAGVMGLLLSRPPVKKFPARYAALGGGLLVLTAGCLALPRLFGETTADSWSILRAVLAAGAIAAIAAPLLEITAAVLTPPVKPEPYSVEGGGGVEDDADATGAWAGDYGDRGDGGRRTPRGKPIPHDVFISYSSLDRPVAASICASLEAAGLPCWMAPRDVEPGEDWPAAIATAVAASRVLVLVFSRNSNLSDEVSRELYLGASSKVSMIPFRIEDVKPEPGKAYYLGRTHWLDATNPPSEQHIGQLIEEVRSLISPVPESQPLIDVDASLDANPTGKVAPPA